MCIYIIYKIFIYTVPSYSDYYDYFHNFDTTCQSLYSIASPYKAIGIFV